MSREDVNAAVVITVVSGRHDHLRTQRAFLARSDCAPLRHVVVAVGDPAVVEVVAECPDLPSTVVQFPSTAAGLPMAAARNAGARAALDAGAGTLVFLDVDCVPAVGMVGAYVRAAEQRPDTLLCGAVTYLPPAPTAGWQPHQLAQQRNPHPARPDPAPGTMCSGDPALFWSLSFAVTALAWQRIPPFYEGYLGYGAEDTDFARAASDMGTEILFVGGADAFHQHHAVSDPPVEHLDDIVRNSAVFAQRHSRLPMGGWLAAFEERGLIERLAGLPRRTAPIRLVTIPARHPYLDAVVPTTVRRVDPDRVAAWELDPLLSPDRLAAAAADIDVVHVHFGFDPLTTEALQLWVHRLHELAIPLVLTVHDLRNPHHDEPQRHDSHLQVLIRAASRIITLTDGAAAECERRFGRRPQVIAHPTLLTAPQTAGQATRPLVLVPLKALRRSVRQAPELVRAVAAGARRAGVDTRVLLEPSVLDTPQARQISHLAEEGVIELEVAPYLPVDQLHDLISGAQTCVLPHQLGTHSGWVELCRDLGTRVVAPDCGYYAQQWSEVITYRNNEKDGLDAASLRDAVWASCRAGPVLPATRTTRSAERDVARALHDALYRAVAGR